MFEAHSRFRLRSGPLSRGRLPILLYCLHGDHYRTRAVTHCENLKIERQYESPRIPPAHIGKATCTCFGCFR